ncbi:TerC/Alx family metal homeostasis membrane protein [Agrobacterium vitis]|uniref:TerC/Alx family metal homeostasis membrane protein n=1 Tax=Agrobacterium vitis TaxID=373 RepID=A0ABD6GJ05_AGRVI|nr:TerC family protein [Agrobacterium vitis]MUO80926.1 TerC/Alx family metal homeostasis membrane protein [Agrobacterium vitis]MUO97421.1 TerC/Alx family metal homeostasis membrane protein [Agrobacterium vitis]MUP06547.1 TerC/Alx family metal homeostasis membrane protein [Agrobacterium vitis]MUZ84151.1 TerC/Alx family metal homeostasis membrane protein [Agrobacterium vitis]MVA10832.1 TerC/Alx family metal homeostasis membrane protein [Agrobacterium vitis]
MDFLWVDFMGKPTWMWLFFLAIVLFLLVLDLGVLHKNSKEIGMAESFAFSAFYITLGVLFGGWIWWQSGPQAGLEYLTGFVIEKSLAMDNIFVIAMIFGYFAIPRAYQHRVLLYGILGVIVLRGIMIAAGAAIVESYHWVLYFFAAFLVFTGVKMLLSADSQYDVANNPALKLARRYLPVTDKLEGDSFVVRKQDETTGKLKTYITPLLLALIMVEFVDLVFAVDSIPAIFAITTDPYIVYTSNIFAILGLRALYFALSALIHRFAYLKYALSVVLIFIGSKIFLADMLGIAKIPPLLSLTITLAILAAGIVGSLWATRKDEKKDVIEE